MNAVSPGAWGHEVMLILMRAVCCRYIEVARSAVWSLGRLASACLGASPTAAAAAASPEQQQLLQQEAWRLLSGQVLHVVVTMLMSCHLQVSCTTDRWAMHMCCLYWAQRIEAALCMHSSCRALSSTWPGGGTPDTLLAVNSF